MPPDLACYEEHYRLTGGAVLGLVASLLSVGLGFLWHTPVIFAVIAVFLAALTVTMPGGGVIDAARRAIAFRADYAGITLGAVPGKLSGRGPAVFIPWADIKRIVLYRPARQEQGGHTPLGIGIQRLDGALPLSQSNEQAPGCPVPGVAAGTSRKITGWRLDRERLAAVIAAVAPGIPIVDAGTAPSPGVEGPGQAANAPELGPAD
jgi:hypothetical protein